jgi:hypothetical protein
MSTSVLRSFTGSGIRLATLSVLLLGMAGAGTAQAPAVSAGQGKGSATAQPPQAPATTPAKGAPAQAANAGAKPAGGMREGIQIHGHWVIEVRNPDGKLVSHTEFENALQTGGQNVISAVLSEQWTPGDWEIVLDQNSASSSPCTVAGYSPSPCYIVTPGATQRNYWYQQNCAILDLSCYVPLRILPPGSAGATFTLQGTATATSGGVIGDVETWLEYCTPSTLAANCAPYTPANASNVVGGQEFSAANLPQGPPPGTAPNLCGGSGQPICAVNVAAGQIISATVTFSFQ